MCWLRKNDWDLQIIFISTLLSTDTVQLVLLFECHYASMLYCIRYLLILFFFNFRFTAKCNDCVQYFCLKLNFNIWWVMKEYKNVIIVYSSEFCQAYMCCRISDTYVTEYRYFLNWISGWLVMCMPTCLYAIWSLQHTKSFKYQKVGSSCMITKIMKKIVKTFLEIIIWDCEVNKVLIKKVSKITREVRIP